MGKVRKFKEFTEVVFTLEDLFTRVNPLPWWMFLYAQDILKRVAPAEYEQAEDGSITLEDGKIVARFYSGTK